MHITPQHVLAFSLFLCAAIYVSEAHADDSKSTEGHGPSSTSSFSHNFTSAAHSYDLQWNVHMGLSQPLLLDGFNIASDLRVGRWVFEYSHGMNLDYSSNDSVQQAFSSNGSAYGLASPWTTGFGVGYTVVDDLYIMAEAKLHRYTLSSPGDSTSYTTASLGPALAYRLFLWRGLNMTTYLRYWPNVWKSTPDETVTIAGETQDVVNLGFFANVSLGWAFDL